MHRNRVLHLVLPILVALIAPLHGSPARADDIEFERPPTSGQLDDLTREIGIAAFGHKLGAAEHLGPARFEIQFGATATQINEDEDYWNNANGGDSPSGTLATGRASLRVGLPWHIDLGIFAERLDIGSAESEGAEAKWEFIKGDNAMPAFAARVTYGRLRNIDELRADTWSADVSISKGLGPFTPYAGIGRMWLDAKVSDIDGFPDDDVTASPGVNEAFLGARLSLGWFRIHGEALWGAGIVSYALTAGFKFP
jgi:hypothetical protein